MHPSRHVRLLAALIPALTMSATAQVRLSSVEFTTAGTAEIASLRTHTG